MKTLRLLAVILLASASAFAWPSCSGSWVQVPAGTSSANGAIYTTGDNLTFQCQKISTAPPVTGTTATSTANSNSSATSSATGGNSKATGGSVTGSGNSTNNNTANGGAGGNASQTQSQSNTSTNSNQSSAANNGNNSNDSTSITNIKPSAESAITPIGFPTAPCLGTFGGAAQAIPGGISFGGSKVDKGCDARQTALQFAVTLGNRLAAAKILCSTKAAKRAKLTLDDCLAFTVPTPAPVAVVVPPVVPTPQPVVVTVNVPEPIVLHETYTVTATRAQVRAAQQPVVKKPVVKRTPCTIPNSLKTPISTEK